MCLDSPCCILDLVTIQAFIILMDLGLEVPQQTLEVNEVILFRDKESMDLGHVGNTKLPSRRIVVAEKASG